MIKLVVIILVLLGSASAFAIEDTVENRSNEAERYLSVNSPKEILQDIAKQMALNYPPEKREFFIKVMTQYLDIELIAKSAKNSMIKIYTADELAAMADFYGSPVGMSATKKTGAYMAEVSPTIQAEAMKAVTKAYREMKESEVKDKTDPAN